MFLFMFYIKIFFGILKIVFHFGEMKTKDEKSLFLFFFKSECTTQKNTVQKVLKVLKKRKRMKEMKKGNTQEVKLKKGRMK